MKLEEVFKLRSKEVYSLQEILKLLNTLYSNKLADAKNVKKIIENWKFWLPIVISMAIGVLIFSKIIVQLLDTYSMPTMYFFVGLIAGSIPLIIRKIRSACMQNNSVPIKTIILLSISFIIGIALVCILSAPVSKDASEVLAPHTNFFLLFIAGAAAAIAMIIPGVSGSFLLVALGMYYPVMQAISVMNLAILIPFGIGVIAGLIGGAALVRFLMQRIPAYTYAAILGLIVGSLICLFPGIASTATMSISAITALLGFCAAYFSSRNEG